LDRRCTTAICLRAVDNSGKNFRFVMSWVESAHGAIDAYPPRGVR